ncbi:putative acyl-CoA dehydrogenase FadE [Rhizocola hellebori]|uniref:Putative acyl-CoA dehydrogenase FadE n=1 Tax=Rhizocola hellebori TaxID=1392758 RepID=A0A8J3QJY6_9ACTN|nr:acyl-CoA dehydrogenase family protein [Rhizocola hellebori]GIH11017.1 putative acyl-CoA dehydrogenase FadE [Rhizocola hellebori]
MNFELGPDEELLIASVREALSRTDTMAAARNALDGAQPAHLWQEAVRGGWTDMPGLLYGVLVLIECGRRLAPTGLLGHLTAVAALRPHADHPAVAAVLPGLLDGTLRAAAAFTPATAVPDAPGADVLVVDGGVVVREFTAQRAGGYDQSLPLGDVSWERGEGFGGDAGFAWNVAQTLLAAQALGAAEGALAIAVEYAKQRKAFGRAIGSFQAIKHQLTEVLRLNENARSLLYYASYAAENEPSEFGLAANAARFAADQAIDLAARRCLSVHGGLGATWEHDAHLYFRRAQLTRLLLGGQAAAGEKVVGHVFSG